eukprot:gene25890-biopygen10557
MGDVVPQGNCGLRRVHCTGAAVPLNGTPRDLRAPRASRSPRGPRNPPQDPRPARAARAARAARSLPQIRGGGGPRAGVAPAGGPGG